MGKNKKRNNEDIGETSVVERSPKKFKDSKSASPHGKNQSPKRPAESENGMKKSPKGTPKKPTPALVSVEDLFPKKRVAAHSVSLKNGFSGVLDNVNETEDDKVETENVELNKSPQKSKKTKSAAQSVEKSKASTSETKSPKKTEPVSPKSKKTNGTPTKASNGTSSTDLSLLFSEHDRLLPGSKRTSMTQTYVSSGPYKHVVIPNLINDDLLKSVRTEILTHLHFTPKQTDIYSVSQTGDLANLSGLPSSEVKSLPSLLKLRNALYSQEFRDFLCAVTGVKGLSGIKTDMSINSYLKGGHLLTHDDVIGTRCVSFILYLVQGDGEGGWKDEWGGGLRLYNTSDDGVPENEPCLTIPPKWNQMSMFAVQPGKSFHDVEEVYTSEHPRLAISGWFHVPQEGEPEYSELDTSVEEKALSSLEQLTSIAEDKMWSFTPLPETTETDFNEEDLEFLSKWINEVYLTPDVVEQLHEAMTEESLLELPDFLNAEVAKSLHQHLSAQDKSPTTQGWQIAGPPHKQRFRYTHETIHPTLNILELFQHPAFRKWLHHVTDLETTSQRSIARHFRPGSDYTLATEHTANTPQLEATLSLTPSALKPKPKKATGISAKAVLSAKETGWTTGEFGGYEVYLAPSGDEEADPAVYKANEGDDGVLVSSDAAWNVFSLVLRDTGVLKFVKYVSHAAWGGRWDVTSEWSVKYDDDDEKTADANEQGEDATEEETILEEEEEWTGIPS